MGHKRGTAGEAPAVVGWCIWVLGGKGGPGGQW